LIDTHFWHLYGLLPAVINGKSIHIIGFSNRIPARLWSGPSVVAGLPQIIESCVLSGAAHLAGIQTFSLHGLAAALRNARVICFYCCFITAMNAFKR
jgi:hypothetical protein